MKLLPIILMGLLTTGCVDARSAANTTAGFISRTADSSDAPARSARQVPGRDVVAFVDLEVTITEVESAGPVSAFGMHWIAAPTAEESLSVYDVPGADGEIVGELQPWANNFWVAERVRRTGQETWRRVTLADGTAGWIKARHLLAQPMRLTNKDTNALRSLAVKADLSDPVLTDRVVLSASILQVELAAEESNFLLLFDWSDREIELVAVLEIEQPTAS